MLSESSPFCSRKEVPASSTTRDVFSSRKCKAKLLARTLCTMKFCMQTFSTKTFNSINILGDIDNPIINLQIILHSKSYKNISPKGLDVKLNYLYACDNIQFFFKANLFKFIVILIHSSWLKTRRTSWLKIKERAFNCCIFYSVRLSELNPFRSPMCKENRK